MARTVEHDGMRLIAVQIIDFTKPDTALASKQVAGKDEVAPGVVFVARGMEDREIIPSRLGGLHRLELVQHPVNSAVHRRRRTWLNQALIDLCADRRQRVHGKTNVVSQHPKYLWRGRWAEELDAVVMK